MCLSREEMGLPHASPFEWITINWKILKEMGIPDHLICLLRNLYTGQDTAIDGGVGCTKDSIRYD